MDDAVSDTHGTVYNDRTVVFMVMSLIAFKILFSITDLL